MNPAHARAHSRIRVWKARLWSRADLGPLLYAADARARRRALLALTLDPDRAVEPQLLTRVVAVYRAAIHAYAGEDTLLRALLRLHELENLKLGWRAIIRRHAEGRWAPLWRDLQDLTALPIEPWRGATDLSPVTSQLAATPYGAIAEKVRRAAGDDLAAAEAAFDRWGSSSVLEAADPREKLARSLAENVVIERTARQQRGDVAPVLERRLQLCRRAFVTDQFTLAPAVALVLMAELEQRAATSAAESAGT